MSKAYIVGFIVVLLLWIGAAPCEMYDEIFGGIDEQYEAALDLINKGDLRRGKGYLTSYMNDESKPANEHSTEGHYWLIKIGTALERRDRSSFFGSLMSSLELTTGEGKSEFLRREYDEYALDYNAGVNYYLAEAYTYLTTLFLDDADPEIRQRLVAFNTEFSESPFPKIRLAEFAFATNQSPMALLHDITDENKFIRSVYARYLVGLLLYKVIGQDADLERKIPKLIEALVRIPVLAGKGEYLKAIVYYRATRSDLHAPRWGEGDESGGIPLCGGLTPEEAEKEALAAIQRAIEIEPANSLYRRVYAFWMDYLGPDSPSFPEAESAVKPWVRMPILSDRARNEMNQALRGLPQMYLDQDEIDWMWREINHYKYSKYSFWLCIPGIIFLLARIVFGFIASMTARKFELDVE